MNIPLADDLVRELDSAPPPSLQALTQRVVDALRAWQADANTARNQVRPFLFVAVQVFAHETRFLESIRETLRERGYISRFDLTTHQLRIALAP